MPSAPARSASPACRSARSDVERARYAGVATLVALLASAAIVIGSPYIGQLRAAVQEALPDQYRAVVGGIVLAGVVAAVAAAIFHIREHRAARYALIVAALVIAAAYARFTRTGNVEQDLVEQFHFVEFGLLTYLFYRVWHHRRDLTAVVLPACAGIVVGIADEWVQWFVPSRVGEFHDILINGVAVACGLLFSAGVAPPQAIVLPPDRGTRKAIAAGLSAVLVATPAFVDAVHRGHIIRESDVGRFRSTFSRPQLEVAAAERVARWRARPPATEWGFAREDHYLGEARWHIQRRNDARDSADLWTAWNENLILEKYFAPALDLGSRWPANAREALAATSVASVNGYESDAEPYPIVVVSRWRFWLGAAGVVAACWLVLVGRARAGTAAARV